MSTILLDIHVLKCIQWLLSCVYIKIPKPKKTQKAPYHRSQTPSNENPNPKKPNPKL